ncbi:MAG: hypothetical protein IKF82_00650 [Bacilli bacterium]|nr:hypothetical protein [Bacilli bacterium]
MFDSSIYLAVIIAIIFRLVIMKGSFVLPTFYKNGNEISFNLGSVSTIIIGLLAAFALMQTQPDLFANWYVAAVTAYTAPQVVDGVITAGTRYSQKVETEESSKTSEEEFEYDDEDIGV